MENTTQANKISIKINIKTAIIIGAVIVLAALAYVYKGLFVAALVDGSPISRLTVIQGLEKASGKDLLETLINEKLIQNEAKAKGIVVSDEEVSTSIKTIGDQILAQGETLDSVLAAQGMSMEELRKQILLQKELEVLLADKISVTDQEVAQYIKDNSIKIQAGQEATTTAQIKDSIKSQKLSTEAGSLIATLRSQAKIKYFVNY